jgi:hypothetical protein
MKLIKNTIYGLLSLAVIQQVNAAPCSIYEHTHLRGWRIELQDGIKYYFLPIFRNIHDQASSIHVAPGCTLTLWEHSDFGGRSQEFYSSNTNSGFKEFNLHDYNFGDIASTASCSCNPQENDTPYSNRPR